MCVSTFSCNSPRPLNNFLYCKIHSKSTHFSPFPLLCPWGKPPSPLTDRIPTASSRSSSGSLPIRVTSLKKQIRSDQIIPLIKIFYLPNELQGFPSDSAIKNPACNAGDAGSVPGSGRSPGGENGNPLQYSFLENPMDRGALQATVHGVTRVGHDIASKPPQ